LARQLSDHDLVQALNALARADDGLKGSGGPQQTRLLLELLLLELARGRAPTDLKRQAPAR